MASKKVVASGEIDTLEDFEGVEQDTLDAQEHLSLRRLKYLQSKKKAETSARPESSVIELMNWAVENYGSALKDKDVEKFIHGNFMVDGQFLHYCDINDIAIETLQKDSTMSHISSTGAEKFFCQGVFLIKSDNVEFLTCSLAHKSTDWEDDVFSFVIVPTKKYEEYIRLRDDLDVWMMKRDRSNLHIRVVDGEDIPYVRDQEWDDLFLPKDLKTEVKSLIETFLNGEKFYKDNKLPYKRGCIFYGPPGCHAAGTKVIMFDGSEKNVEDVVIGDFLMGPNSQPREVLRLVRGEEEMFRVHPRKSSSFVVNKGHILHLEQKVSSWPSAINISVGDFLSMTKCSQERFKLVHSKAVSFSPLTSQLAIDPYFLGVWLGDGNSHNIAVTTADAPIKDYIEQIAFQWGLNVKTYKKPGGKTGQPKCATYHLTSKEGTIKSNLLRNEFNKLNLLNNKHIPSEYKTASYDDRMQLLSGFVDTEGSYSTVRWRDSEKRKIQSKGYYEILQKSDQITTDILFIARSLGFRVTCKKVTKSIKSTGFSGTYNRISISGDINRIPVKLDRKKAAKGSPNKDPMLEGIISITSEGIGKYYGFTIDGDHLYLTNDFKIHHNCGKTSLIRTIISNYNFKPITITPGADNEALFDAFLYAEEQSPSLLFFEDIDSMLDRTVDLSLFLNLMDGISAKNGLLVIATANDISSLKPSVIDRPSRFDRKFFIPPPTKEMSAAYLKKWFGSVFSEKKIQELAAQSEQYGLSYAFLKELYLSTMFEALSNNRKVPNEKDTTKAFEKLMKDKNIFKGKKKTINIDTYIK